MIAKWQLPTALSFMGVLTLMANFQWLNRHHWCFSIFAVRIDARFVRLYVSLVYLTSCGLFIVGWLKEYWIYKLSLLKGCDNLFPDSQKFAAFESVGYVFVCLLCNVLSQRRNWNWNLDLMKLCTNVKLIKGNSHFNETPWRSVIYLSFTCILVQVGYLYCYTPCLLPLLRGTWTDCPCYALVGKLHWNACKACCRNCSFSFVSNWQPSNCSIIWRKLLMSLRSLVLKASFCSSFWMPPMPKWEDLSFAAIKLWLLHKTAFLICF